MAQTRGQAPSMATHGDRGSKKIEPAMVLLSGAAPREGHIGIEPGYGIADSKYDPILAAQRSLHDMNATYRCAVRRDGAHHDPPKAPIETRDTLPPHNVRRRPPETLGLAGLYASFNRIQRQRYQPLSDAGDPACDERHHEGRHFLPPLAVPSVLHRVDRHIMRHPKNAL
eukprot:CAMPEP_0119467318 /NCGR_PEP_ID=MMETSP1344-20130328/1558_1 /TAXON_ID=236787 /ORGANISM="Florenciella parvula, Strain CCMP2471" /LENGTH=169 /DNA_ID=CAMNT_0007499675 /DNA_START=59 /DNA_END=569 /DNA_ORIENTATION=-